MTKQEFANGMAFLATVYGQDMTSERMTAWFSLFEMNTLEEFAAAARKCALTSKFFPSVAELKAAIAESAVGMISADEAWNKILEAIRRFGWWKSEEAMKSLPPAVARSVNNMGGFKRLCESEDLEWTRKDFMKIYEIQKNRDETDYTTGTLITIADVVAKKKLLEGES